MENTYTVRQRNNTTYELKGTHLEHSSTTISITKLNENGVVETVAVFPHEALYGIYIK